MTNKEYIKREKAIEEIDSWLDSVGSIIVGKGLSSYGELIGCIQDVPAADVEEVVYCKNCKFRYTHTCFAKHETSDNDYCSCGARMALSDCEIIPSDVAEVVKCIDCKHLMFSDFYGECSRGYMGIVTPDDYCSRGVRKDGERE